MPRATVALETHEQQAFIVWWRYQHPHTLIYAIPNGAYLAGDAVQRAKQAGRLEREGALAGIPDAHIPEHRLWIEFKRVRGGRLSAEQIAIHGALRAIGHTVIVANGWTDAVEKIKDLGL